MKISNRIKTEDWQAFVNDHPDGNIFQSPGMYDFFKSVKKFDPVVMGVVADDRRLCGVLAGIYIHERSGLFKLLSSRFVIYGGPLISGDENTRIACLDLLLNELIRTTKHKALFIQFRNYFCWKDYLDVFEKYGFKFLERQNYIVSIKGIRSKVWSNLSSNRRRQIEKGIASGAKIVEPENLSQVREFYEILYKLYRYKVRKPLADWSFFENFYNLTSPVLSTKHQEPLGIIRLICYKDRIIGGILAPVFKNKCIYEWYVCGLDHEYKQQYPSVLATWAALDYAIENNIEKFDFMGVGRPDISYGVRDFKARFGGELVNYGRLTKINNKLLYNTAEFGYNVLALLRKI